RDPDLAGGDRARGSWSGGDRGDRPAVSADRRPDHRPRGFHGALGAVVRVGRAQRHRGRPRARLPRGLRRSLPDRAAGQQAAALPAVLLALYFTYSRGGVLTLAVGLICLLALSHQRLWHLASFALALAVTVPVMFAVQARRSLADGLGGGAMASQGLVVLLL